MSVTGVGLRQVALIGLMAALGASARPAGQARSPIRPALNGSGVIIGRVVDADTGEGINDAVVTLNTARTSMVDAVRTTRDGTFVFMGVPAGEWQIGAVKTTHRGSGSSLSRVPVSLSAGGTVRDAVLRLQRFAVLGGVVIDEAGEPVVDAPVRLLARNGSGRWGSGRTTRSDDRGEFRFSSVAPNDYLVMVPSIQASLPVEAVEDLHELAMADPAAADRILKRLTTASLNVPREAASSGARVDESVVSAEAASNPALSGQPGERFAYPTQLHPAADSTSTATVISLKSGDRREGITLHLRAVRAYPVWGTVRTASGPGAGLIVRLLPADGNGLATPIPSAVTVTDRGGRFRFPFVPSGVHQLVIRDALNDGRVQPPGQLATVETGSETTTVAGFGTTSSPVTTRPDMVWASVPLDVSSGPLEGLEILARSGLRISGRIETDPQPNPGTTGSRPARATIRAVSLEDGGLMPSAQPDADGRFELTGLLPGPYVISAFLPAPWHIGSVILGPEEFADRPIDLEEDVIGLLVRLTTVFGTVTGTVRSADGTSGAGAQVLLFPDDRSLWIANPALSRRVRTVRAASNGTFTLPGVPSGDYLIAAFPYDSGQGWNTREGLDLVARSAQSLRVADGTRHTISLRLTGAPGLGVPALPPDRFASWSPAAELRSRDSDPLNRPAGPHVPDGEQTGPMPRQASAPGQSGSIAGTIHGSAGETAGLRGVMVTLTGTGARVVASTYSDAHGAFVFHDLPAGRYRVSASKPAHLTTEYGSRRQGQPGASIPLANGEQRRIGMVLPRAGVIAGTVFDRTGEPLEGVTVRVMQQARLGRDTVLAPGRSVPAEAVTDDRGRYRFYGLDPGSYVIGVTPGIMGAAIAGRLLDDDIRRALRSVEAGTDLARRGAAAPARQAAYAYATTFHPSSIQSADAVVIDIAPDVERLGIDVQMRFAPSVGLSGHVVGPQGAPVGRVGIVVFPDTPYVPADMMIAPPSVPEVAARGGAARVTAGPAGEFRVLSLAPGRYRVVARTVDSSTATPILWADTTVTLGAEDVEDFAVALHESATLSGVVVQPASGARPGGLTVALSPAGHSIGRVSVPPAPVGPDGRFQLAGVVPGEYWIEVRGLAPSLVLLGSSPAETGPPDVPVQVRDGQPINVRLALSDRPAELSGTFAYADGGPASEFHVVLFPDEEDLRIPGSRRIRTTRLDTDGRYVFAGLPPGDYRLAALFDLEGDGWLGAALRPSLDSQSIPVPLRAGERVVRDIVLGRSRANR